MGWAFVPAGTGIQHPATSAHNTAPPHKGAHGQSRGEGRIGGGCDPSLAPWNVSPWPPNEEKTTKGNCSVKAMQGPSGNTEKGTQEFGLPGPYPDQGKKSHKSRRQPAPLLSQGPSGPSKMLLSTEPHLSQGLKGKLRHKGSGRVALTARHTPFPLLLSPVASLTLSAEQEDGISLGLAVSDYMALPHHRPLPPHH